MKIEGLLRKDGKPLVLPSVFNASEYDNAWKPELSEEEYHKSHHSLSSTLIRTLIQKSPRHYLQKLLDYEEDHEDEDGSKSMKFGKDVHLMILEPERFKQKYQIMPQFEGHHASTAYKQAKERWLANLPTGAVVMKEEEFNNFYGVITALSGHGQARELFSKGTPEMAGFFVEPETGILCRIKPDFLYDTGEGLILIDLKTTRHSTSEGFEKSIADYRYDIQLAMYKRGVELITGRNVSHCVWVTVENKAPNCVAVYEVDAGTLDYGYQSWMAGMKDLKWCLDRGEFPSPQQDARVIGLPYWQFKKEIKTKFAEVSNEAF